MSIERTNTAVWSASRRRWEISVQRDGKRRRFTSATPGRTGQREANRKADNWLSGAPEARKDRLRVSAAIDVYRRHTAELWAARRGQQLAPDAKIRGKDLGSDRPMFSLLDTWTADISTRWVDKISDFEVQTILDKAYAAGRSRKTIKDIRQALLAFLKFCRRAGYTEYRPDDVEIPKNSRNREKHILQPEDLTILFSSDRTLYRGKEVFDPNIYAYRFVVLTGIRPGENAFLRAEDIEGNIAHIRGSLNADGEITTGKNSNAIRDVVLHPLAMEQVRLQLFATGRRAGPLWEIYRQDTFREQWYRYCAHNGLPHITPYELRHTFVSIAQELPEGQLKMIVGHSKSMDTRGVYGHEMKGQKERTAQNLQRIFSELLASAGNE